MMITCLLYSVLDALHLRFVEMVLLSCCCSIVAVICLLLYAIHCLYCRYCFVNVSPNGT